MARRKNQQPVDGVNRIREVRKSRGITARDLADRMTAAGHPFSYTAITKVENHQRTLHHDTLHVIAGILDVPPESLIDTAPPTQKVPVVPADEVIDLLVSGQPIESEHEISVDADGRLIGITGLRTELGDGILVVDLAQKELEPGYWLVSEKGRLHVEEVGEGDHLTQAPAAGAPVGYMVGLWKPLDLRIPYRDIQRNEAERRHEEERPVERFIRRRLKLR